MAIDFICGYECRILAAGAAPVPNERHWDSGSGTPTISTTTVRSGTAALRANTIAGTGTLHKAIARRTVAGRIYVRWAAFPIIADGSAAFLVHASTGNLSIRMANSGQLSMQITGGSAINLGSPLSLNTWYRIDWLADTSTGTHSLKAQIDGGTEVEATSVVAAADMTFVRTGVFATATMDVFYDDLILGDATGDYPFGEGTVERMKPTRDGTHSFTAADFGYDAAGGDVATSATDVNTYVDDDDMSSIVDGVLIRQKAANTVGYVEVGFGSAPFSHDALAVMVVNNFHASTTGANTFGVKMNDGGTVVAVTDAAGDALGDYSNVTFTQAEKIFLTAPSGGAWTQAKIEAALIRAGYATDVVGIPYWDGVMLEVAYGPAAGGQTVTPTTASLTTATFAPVVTASDHQSVTPTTRALVTASFAPTVSLSDNQMVTPGVTSLTLTPFVPTVALSDHQSVTPDTASLSTTAFAPSVATTEHQTVVPDTGALTLTTFAPTVTAEGSLTVTPGTASLSLSGFAPSVSGITQAPAAGGFGPFRGMPEIPMPVAVEPGTARLWLTTYPPTVEISNIDVDIEELLLVGAL